MRKVKEAAVFLTVAAALSACETTDASLTPEQLRVREAAFNCAGSEYDRIFLTAGQDDRMYRPDDRNQITGILRDSAVAGQGADADSGRRVRNYLGEGYGSLFLDAYEACMRANT